MSTQEGLGLELPEEIIQHIQSFMKPKLSAETSLLSKAWYKAWSNRPTLYFKYMKDINTSDPFLDFVKTVERYLALNIKLDKFVLETVSSNVTSIVDKLIIDVLNLRVNIIDLCFYKIGSYVLPAQVFAHKYLTELRLDGVKVDHLIPANVLCSNLRSLTLKFVSVDNNTFTNILIGCPIIQHLALCFLRTPSKRINATELQNLKTLILSVSPAITSSLFCGQFLNLTGLKLKNVTVDHSFFTNLSSTFPNLEDLNLEYNNLHRNIQIPSRSIKRLTLKYRGTLEMAHFDVPNIRNFKLLSDYVPLLSFTASSQGWKSDITFSESCGVMDLSKVREFLIKLSCSKITLHLPTVKYYRYERNIEVSRLTVVEELTYAMQLCTEYNFFIECLLSCRPKIVSILFSLKYSLDMISYMYKKLIELSQNCFGASSQYLSQLQEVNVEIFEESLKEWQPIHALSDDLEILNFRFKLKWGSLTLEQTIIKFIQY